MRVGRLPRFAFALAASFAAVLAARAEFKDEYALGLKALDDGRYLEARRHLDLALAAQSEPVEKVILNGNIEQPYLPYHFLGLVAYKLGDCDLAKALWGNPMNARMVGRLTQVRQQEQRLNSTCKPAPGVVEKGDKSTNAEVAGTPAPVPPAPVPPVAAEKPTTPPTRGEARERAGAAASTDANKATDAANAAERAPPSRLVKALDNYLAGRYDEAARIEPESFSRPRARFHALLIRAAARYTQAQLNGNKVLLAAARADADGARALEPNATPDAALFSPRFRAFYAETH